MGDQADIDVQTAGGDITRRVRWTITDFIATMGQFGRKESIAAEQLTILASDDHQTPLASLALRCFPNWDLGLITVEYRLTRLGGEVGGIAKGDISVYGIDKDGHKWDGFNCFGHSDDDEEKEEDTRVICKGGFFTDLSKLMREVERLLPDNALILCFEVTLAAWPTVVTRIAKPALIIRSVPTFALSKLPPPMPPTLLLPPVSSLSSMPIDRRGSLSRLMLESFVELAAGQVKLTFSDGELLCHTFPLAARSSVFRAMLTADMAERNSGQIRLPDVKLETGQELLAYLYDGQVARAERGGENLMALLSLADRYELAELRAGCAEGLAAAVSEANYLQLLNMAQLYDIPFLRTAVIGYIVANASQLVAAPAAAADPTVMLTASDAAVSHAAPASVSTAAE